MPPHLASVKEIVIFEAAKFSYRQTPIRLLRNAGKHRQHANALANQERRRQLNELIGTQGQRLARENECEQVSNGLALASDWFIIFNLI